MKRRVFAILVVIPILLVMVVVTPVVGASSGTITTPSYDSLVNIASCYYGGGDISTAGSVAQFTLTIEVPGLAANDGNPDNGVHGQGNLTLDQLMDLEISMGSGSAFGFASGEIRRKLFAGDTSLQAGQSPTSATFDISMVYTGRGNDLVLTLSHPTLEPPGGTSSATASSTWSFFIKETIPGPTIEIPAPDPPNYGATPLLTLLGSLPTLEAGKAENIRFTLTNNSQHVAYGVAVTILEGTDKLFRPMTISGSVIQVGTIRIGNTSSASVTIPVEVFDDVKEGYYTIPLRLTMTNNAGSSIEQNSSIQVFIKNPNSSEDKGKPSLIMTSATVDKNTPGSDGIVALTLTIANIGDGEATDARINLTGFKGSEITLNESLVTKSLGNIAPGSRATATYSLKVAEELQAGSYPLNVDVRYRISDDTEEKISDIAYVNIIRLPETHSDVDMQLVGISQDVSNPGSSNIIRATFTIQNKGSSVAEGVSIGLKGLSSSSFTLSGEFGDKALGNLAPDEFTTTTMSLYVSENLSNGNYPLSVVINYSDPDAIGAQQKTVETEVYIFVNRPEKKDPDDDPDNPDNSVPRVIISRHSISVDNVVAGNPFELSVTLLNTSMRKNIKNLKVTVTDKDGIFIPVEGVNSFYIAEIPIGQTTDISIILSPKQDAETKSYPLSISLDYEDEKDTSYSVTESLSIPVYLPQRLEISNVSFFESGMGMGVLNFQFINKGKSSLYNLNIRIEGPMSAMEGDYYIGMFGPGQSDYFEDSIIPQMYGEISGDIVMEYEDTAGTLQELRYPITAFINEPFMQDPGFSGDIIWDDPSFPFQDGFDADEGGGMPGWLIWSIVGVVVIIGGVSVIIIVKREKRKKIELADDE